MEYKTQHLTSSGYLKSTVAIPGWAQEMIEHPEGRSNPTDAFAKVPQLYRAVMLRANALACVPFVVRKGEKLVSWPFPQTLSKLLGELEASLMVAGGAYALKLQPASGGTRTVGLQYLSPTTMSVKYDPGTRTTTYTQRIGAMEYGPWTSERMVFLREFSFTTDVGSGLAPARVALPAANLRIAMQEFASGFFSSGGQPMTLLTVAGNPSPVEIDRTERFFKRTMQGVRNAWRVLALRSEVNVQAITPAINTMAMPEMHETTTREIAAAFGIPLSLLTSDSANYATAQSDMRLFYENTIKARLMMYEAALNEQLLGEMGLTIKFTPEALAIYQEDEAERSSALLNLVNAGMPLSNAMLILGYAVEDVTGLDTATETVTTSGAVIEAPAPAPKALMPTEPPMEDQPLDDEWLDNEYAAQAYEKSAQAEAKAWAKVAGKDLQRALEFDCEHLVPEMEHWVKAQLTQPGAEVAHIIEHAGKTLRLTNKDQRAVAAVVSRLFKRYGPKIKDAAARGEIDYDATNELFGAVAEGVAPKLEDVYLHQLEKVITQADRDPAAPEYTTTAKEWSLTRASGLQSELINTTIKSLQRAVAKLLADPALTATDVAAGLFPTFSPYRVAMIATTEVTRAKAAATNETYDVLTDYGDDVVRRWLTEADESVCPICGPLDRTLEKTYSKRYGQGPPAHPNCRCDIGVEVAQAGAGSDG